MLAQTYTRKEHCARTRQLEPSLLEDYALMFRPDRDEENDFPSYYDCTY